MANLPLALPADTILAGKYVIQQTLGQGGFGITYIAEDYKTKEKVVMKEFFPDTMVTRGQNNAISGPSGENLYMGKIVFWRKQKHWRSLSEMKILSGLFAILKKMVLRILQWNILRVRAFSII